MLLLRARILDRGDGMRLRRLILLSIFYVAGCAKIEFNDGWVAGGAHFYDPAPYVLVTVSKDCTTNAVALVLPGRARTMSFLTGYGSTELSASFQNGMLTSVGQKTDTKIPETITALTGLASAIPGLIREAPVTCSPKAILFEIRDGTIDPNKPIQLPIS